MVVNLLVIPLKIKAMKNISAFGVFLLMWLCQITVTLAGDNTMTGVTEAIKKTDATKLATFFSNTIDLEVGEISGTYSKVQAEEIVRDFFKKTPLKTFTVKHEGSSNDGSEFLIGTYQSASKNYRVYVLMKKEFGTLLIKQLQFEVE